MTNVLSSSHLVLHTDFDLIWKVGLNQQQGCAALPLRCAFFCLSSGCVFSKRRVHWQRRLGLVCHMEIWEFPKSFYQNPPLFPLFPFTLTNYSQLPGRTHSCLMKDDVCCHWRFKDGRGGYGGVGGLGEVGYWKVKRHFREFSLEPSHESPFSAQSQGYGRRVVFRKTLMVMDGENEKWRRKEWGGDGRGLEGGGRPIDRV